MSRDNPSMMSIGCDDESELNAGLLSIKVDSPPSSAAYCFSAVVAVAVLRGTVVAKSNPKAVTELVVA